MSNTIIKIENLSKRYIIGHQSQDSHQYKTLRDQLALGAKRIGKRLLHPLKASSGQPLLGVDESEEFWALKDVSFEVKQGNRIGIIGRNGAGKSTLLKILSRITEPTTGKIQIKGRIASLLEVGTGFHPELTGRENIFLNGAVLGMSRQEIKKKFDEIVAFAEVEKFLDTPVKRYSSGMYVRLAFAVAANLEPEILIVDEVLAVGDLQFQKKCLGKMQEVSKEGRTVLFVSHNMAAITSLCRKVILLDSGESIFNGPVSEGILQYYSAGENSLATQDFTTGKKIGDKCAELIKAHIKNTSGDIVSEIDIDQSFKVVMQYKIVSSEKNAIAVPNFHFFTADGTYAFVSQPRELKDCNNGEYLAICHIPENLLNEGAYFVGLALTTYSNGGYKINFFEKNALSFNLRDPMTESIGRYGYAGPIPGVVRPKLNWEIERLN